MTPMRLARSFVALLAAAAVLPVPARAVETEVRIEDNFYFPVFKVVFVGTRAVWTNRGADQHTVTFYDDAPESFDSSPAVTTTCNDFNPLTQEDCIEPGDSVSFTFDEPGTYDYYCKVHSAGEIPPDPDAPATEQPCGMCGRVVVKVEKTPSPRARPTPPIASTPSETASPSPTATPRGSGSPAGTASPDDDAVAAGDDQDDGSGTRAVAAFVLILALAGAGYVTWRRFIARP